MELFDAKQTLVNQIDQVATDLKAQINAVETIDELKAKSTAAEVADTFLSVVTGGTGGDAGYTAYSGDGGLPEGKTNKWAYEQNSKMMRANAEKMVANTRNFWACNFDEIDTDFETGFWPVTFTISW